MAKPKHLKVRGTLTEDLQHVKVEVIHRIKGRGYMNSKQRSPMFIYYEDDFVRVDIMSGFYPYALNPVYLTQRVIRVYIEGVGGENPPIVLPVSKWKLFKSAVEAYNKQEEEIFNEKIKAKGNS